MQVQEAQLRNRNQGIWRRPPSEASRSPMIAYAANTGTLANLEALESAEWRLMLAPYRPRLHPDFKFKFAIDNGAWPAHTNNVPFDEVGFKRLVNTHGPAADFVVVPDIVKGGLRSLDFSLSWLGSLRGLKLL